MSVQAIAGVSPRSESVVMTEYPSLAAWVIGRALGSLYDSIPISIFGLRLSHLLFVLPTAPIALLLYFLQRVFGQYFVLTNRSVQIWGARSGRRIGSVDLADVATVEIARTPGQQFYRAADLLIRDTGGRLILRLEGIPDAGSFANAIRRTAESRRMVQSAMSVIEARG